MEWFLPGNRPNWFPLCLCPSCIYLIHGGVEERKRMREEEKAGDRKRGHQRSFSSTATKTSWVYADTLCVSGQPISTDWDSPEKTPAVCCIELCLHAFLPVFLTAVTSGRGVIDSKEHLHISKQPSKQIVLMKVATVPKYKATLLTTYFPLIKTILSVGTVFFPV